MGTNYYARYNICEHCGRYAELHIGKSSMGWSFSFRGYRPSDWGDERPVIVTEADWKEWLANNPHQITDEYGEEVTDDEFWRWVESKRELQGHYEWCVQNISQLGSDYMKDTWTDQETGSSFTGSEFS